MNQTDKSNIYLAALLEYVPGIDQQSGTIGALFRKVAAYTVGKDILTTVQQAPPTLHSIFSNLLYNKKALKPPPVYQFAKQTFTLEKEAFPKEAAAERKSTAELWADFAKDYALLDKYEAGNTAAKAETVLHLLHRHTVHLPEPTGTITTISHYDFSKSFAGISVCLYEYLKANDSFVEPLFIGRNERPFLLIGGDLSGVQDFLYDIVGKNASKNLKGRSFYLQMLIQSTLNRVLDELQLFQGNVVYSSGGSFLIIAPNIEGQLEKINKLEREITAKLFDTHQTQLSLSLDIVDLALTDIIDGGLKDKMEVLFDKQARKKHQKFASLFKDKNSIAKFFDPEEVNEGGGFPIDALSGEELTETKINNGQTWKFSDEEEPTRFKGTLEDFYKEADLKLISKATYQQIQLGKILKDAAYWVMTETPIKKVKEIEAFNPCELGVYHYLLKKDQLNQLTINAKTKIYTINQDQSFLVETGLTKQAAMGMVLYGGNKFPILEGLEDPVIIKTFSELAGAEEPDRKEKYKKRYPIKNEDTGLKRLGVLRMDVDNLGYMIQNGFGRKFSLVHYSCLSRNLDFFFKGYLNTIWEHHKEAFKQHTQIIYSGGDDLFIVGRWDKMIRLATVIKEDFAAFVAPNKQLTISGGVSIIGHKFPIRKAADMAGKQEKLAKRHQFVSPTLPELHLTKNSFTLFDTPLHWSDKSVFEDAAWDWSNEWHIVEALKNQLLSFLQPQLREEGKATIKGISKGFLQKIAMLYELSESQRKKGKNQKWRWLIAYDFARTKKDLDKKKLYRESAFLGEIERSMTTESFNGKKLKSNHSFFRLLYLAARWAELEDRMEK